MIKTILYSILLCGLSFFCSDLYSQCSVGSVSLANQTELDQFALQVQNCTVIEGNISISYLDITDRISDLSQLSHVTEIQGRLYFNTDVSDTTQVTGLDNLSHVNYMGFSEINYDYLDLSPLTALLNIDTLSLNGRISGYPPALSSIKKLWLSYFWNSSAKLPAGLVVSEDFSVARNVFIDSLTFLSEVEFSQGIDVYIGSSFLSTKGLNLPSTIARFDASEAVLFDIECMANVADADQIIVRLTGDGDLSPFGNLQQTDRLELHYSPQYQEPDIGLQNLSSLSNLTRATNLVLKNLGTSDLTGLGALTNCNNLTIFDSKIQFLDGINPDVGLYIQDITIFDNPQLTNCATQWLCEALNTRRTLNFHLNNNAESCNEAYVMSACSQSLGTIERSYAYLDRNCNNVSDADDPPLYGAYALAYDLNGSSRLSISSGRSYEDGMSYFLALTDTISTRVNQIDTASITPNPTSFVFENNPTRYTIKEVGFCTSTGTDSITIETLNNSIMVPSRFNFAPYTLTNEGATEALYRAYPEGKYLTLREYLRTRPPSSPFSPRDTLGFNETFSSTSWFAPNFTFAGQQTSSCVDLNHDLGGPSLRNSQCFDVEILQSDTANQVFGFITAGSPEQAEFTFTLDNVVSDTARNIFVEVEADSRLVLSSIEHIFIDPRFTFSRNGRNLRWEANNILQFNYDDRQARQAGAVFRYKADLTPQFAASSASIDFGFRAEFDGIPFTSSQITITGGVITNSKEVTESLAVRMFPNPATNKVSVSIEQTPFSYQLFDGLGKLVSQQAITASSHEINLVGLPTGLHHLQVQTERGERSTKKLLIAK
ncbi:MAG: T9SS type A sorting domain-containing protein [Saprospiraceae bacterium]